MTTRRRRVRRAALLSLLGGLLALAAAAAPSVRPARASRSGTAWLDEINRYRVASGLKPVSEQPAWTAGIAAHLTYLARTPADLMTGRYVSAHAENPASPYYTQAGAHEAASSDLVEGAGSDLGAIDLWLAAPFHAIGILRPSLRQVAFARDSKTGDAGLDIADGVRASSQRTRPVLFPGPGMSTDLTAFRGESPTPLETCHWTSAGLPLIALFPRAPSASVAATLTGPAGPVATCLVTARNFVTTDAVYGPTGRAILADEHAVLVIPKETLASGRYTATITGTGEGDVTWSFAVRAPTVAAPRVAASPSTRSAARSVLRLISLGKPVVHGHVATMTLRVRGALVGRRARVTLAAKVGGGGQRSGIRHYRLTLRRSQTLRVPCPSGGWTVTVRLTVPAFHAGTRRYRATAAFYVGRYG